MTHAIRVVEERYQEDLHTRETQLWALRQRESEHPMIHDATPEKALWPTGPMKAARLHGRNDPEALVYEDRRSRSPARLLKRSNAQRVLERWRQRTTSGGRRDMSLETVSLCPVELPNTDEPRRH